jgi:hypothetical protein
LANGDDAIFNDRAGGRIRGGPCAVISARLRAGFMTTASG